MSRLPQLPFQALLKSVRLRIPDLLGTGLEASSFPLFSPGALLLLAALAAFPLQRLHPRRLSQAAAGTLPVILGTAAALGFMVPMVRIFVNSGTNALGIDSMPLLLAKATANAAGAAWPLFAPAVGALGAFVAGSNTFSNMMFSLFQYGIAQEIGASTRLVVALQAVGGAAGNIVSIHNVVAVSAVVGLLGREGELIRRMALPLLYYLLFAGVIGMAAAFRAV